MRTVTVPPRDDLALRLKAVSFSSLNKEDGTYRTDISPATFRRFLREVNGNSEGTYQFDLADYKGLLVLLNSLDPSNDGVFTKDDQDYIVRAFEDITSHVPGFTGQIVKADADYPVGGFDGLPNNPHKDGWIVVYPSGRDGSGSAWMRDLDGDNKFDVGNVHLGTKKPNDFRHTNQGGDFITYHEIMHVVGPYSGGNINRAGHALSLRQSQTISSHTGRRGDESENCRTLCPADVKAMKIFYGYPAKTDLNQVMALDWGVPW